MIKIFKVPTLFHKEFAVFYKSLATFNFEGDVLKEIIECKDIYF